MRRATTGINLRAQCTVWALSAASILIPQAASAQYVMEFAQTYNAPMSNFITGAFLNQQALLHAIAPAKPGVAAPKSLPALPLAPPQVAQSAAELAAMLPAAHRAKMEGAYAGMMPIYQQIERKLGWPPEDPAGAITALLAGNYMAMTGRELSDAAVLAAARQLRGSASIRQLLDHLRPADRRRLYEQCAMLGTFMTLANRTASQQAPAVVAGLRQSARANLRAVLGASGDRLRFSEDGLRLP